MPAAIAIPAIATAVAGGTVAAANIYGSHKQASTARRAGDLEARAAERTLAFAREQEAARQREFQQVQARNYGLYQESQARLAPYRQFGARSLQQIATPISGVGTLGARAGA